MHAYCSPCHMQLLLVALLQHCLWLVHSRWRPADFRRGCILSTSRLITADTGCDCTRQVQACNHPTTSATMFLLQNRSLTCVSARTSYRSVTVQQVRPVTLPRPCSSSPLYARVVTRSASESSPGAVNNSSGAVEGQMSVALMEAMQVRLADEPCTAALYRWPVQRP